jgi:hypothetical protein
MVSLSNHERTQSFPKGVDKWFLILAGSLWLSTIQSALAAGFTVENAVTRLENGHYAVTAKLNYKFSKAVLEALNNGITLTIVLEIKFHRPRPYLWDPVVAKAKQKYRIKHHALSGQYMLVNSSTGVYRSYRDFGEVAEALEEITIPVTGQALLPPDSAYRGRLRSRLDIDSLPPPLRPVAYFSSQWQLSSPWFEWEFRT